MTMKLFHMYGWWFQLIKGTKRNTLHKNVLTIIQLLWVKLFTKKLTPLCMIMCAFAVIIFVLNHKHIIPFTCKMIYPKEVNMWKMKIQFFNFWYVIFWTKTQNTAWFQYKTFPCCNISLSTFSRLMTKVHVFTMLR